MKDINFAEIGCRRLVSDSILLKATNHINNIDNIEQGLVFNLCGCIFAYNLSKLLEAFILKANNKEVSLLVKHSYVATDDQMTSYLSKGISFFPQQKTYAELCATLSNKYNIKFSITAG